MLNSHLPANGISFVVPALNEEVSIELAVIHIIAASEGRLSEYEILLIDDHSTDRTGEIMEDIARRNPRARVFHNERNMGLGGAYKRGVNEAKLEYVMGVWGDNSIPASSLVPILERIGEADIVTSYWPNLREIKTPFRHVASRAYTLLMNALFNLSLQYYNGFTIHRTQLLRGISISSNGFGFQAEIILKLIKTGASYIEVGVLGIYVPAKSKALRIKNLISIVGTILHLMKELRELQTNRGADLEKQAEEIRK